jgi:hypothetical protein
MFLAIEQAAADRLDQVLPRLQKAEEMVAGITNANPTMLYNLACAHAQYFGAMCRKGRMLALGNQPERASGADRAMKALKRAISAGYANVVHLRRDIDLDPLRCRRDFQDLLLDLSFPTEPFASDGRSRVDR